MSTETLFKIKAQFEWSKIQRQSRCTEIYPQQERQMISFQMISLIEKSRWDLNNLCKRPKADTKFLSLENKAWVLNIGWDDEVFLSGTQEIQ